MVAVSSIPPPAFDAFSLGFLDGRAAGPPRVVRAGSAESSVDVLVAWIEAHREALLDARRRHGALLFRGFPLDAPQDFERVARALDPDLQSEYLGTSPRVALTDYVFTASELPGYYPIPQHCKMTFVAQPPKSLFFWCKEAPAPGCGETPLCDFRAVARDMDPELKARFRARGIRIVRNYSGPSAAGRKLGLWELKRWDEIFGTTDRAAVEAACAKQGFSPTWVGADGLRLISHHDAFRPHPETGEEVWFNHSQVFHMSAGPGEYAHIAKLRPSLRNRALHLFAAAMVALKRRRLEPDAQALDATFGDGGPIPDADMAHVRELIWRHMVRFAWQRGDAVAIDNASCSHGRLPYRGPREIAVSWA